MIPEPIHWIHPVYPVVQVRLFLGDTAGRAVHWSLQSPSSRNPSLPIEPINLSSSWLTVVTHRCKPLVICSFEWTIRVHRWSSWRKFYLWSNSFFFTRFSCVISTLCLPNLEFQFVNPTTQVALFSECTGVCPSILNITWNVYQGVPNASPTVMQWTQFNLTSFYENIWFFGKCSLRDRTVADRRIQVDTRRISQLFISYLHTIRGFISGNSKWLIGLMQRIARVLWILKSTNLHKMDRVRSIPWMARPVLSSLFHVRIGRIKMRSKIIHYTVRKNGRLISLRSPNSSRSRLHDRCIEHDDRGLQFRAWFQCSTTGRPWESVCSSASGDHSGFTRLCHSIQSDFCICHHRLEECEELDRYSWGVTECTNKSVSHTFTLKWYSEHCQSNH